MRIEAFDQLSPASTPDDYITLCSAPVDNIVRSREDITMLINSDRNPWGDIPEIALNTFVSSLEFRNGGLAHADFTSLEPHMKLSDFYKSWAFFGIARHLLFDYIDKRCDGHHTCVFAPGQICTSLC